MKTTIKWYGHSVFELTVGEQNLIFDPWFNANPVTDVKASDLKKVDMMAVSHGHSDHFGDAMEILRNTNAKLICSTMISHYINLRGFSPMDGRNVSMSQGGTVVEGNMRISMVDAVHTCALCGDEWPLLKQYFDDGGPVGYVVRTPDEHSIYFAGDTDIFTDMQFIEKRYHPDVAIIPIGGRFTMDCETAIMSMDLLKPKIVIPMHYNTHGGILVDIDKFVADTKAAHPEIKVLVMQPGETFVLEEN